MAGEGEERTRNVIFLTLYCGKKKKKVTPGLSAVEFEQRRASLMKSLPDNAVVICLGYSTRYMTNNIFYQFHQNTDFWYLCGFNEPDAALVLGNNTFFFFNFL